MSTEIHTKDGLAPGTEIFGYVIERLLGRGGMGNVYLAKQKSLDRQVALKVLHPQRLRNPASVDSFLREARAAAVRIDAHADEARRQRSTSRRSRCSRSGNASRNATSISERRSSRRIAIPESSRSW